MTLCWLLGHHGHAALVLNPALFPRASQVLKVRSDGFPFTAADLIREPPRCLHCGVERKRRTLKDSGSVKDE